jgi:hypothetical protein
LSTSTFFAVRDPLTLITPTLSYFDGVEGSLYPLSRSKLTCTFADAAGASASVAIATTTPRRPLMERIISIRAPPAQRCVTKLGRLRCARA